MIQLRDQGLTLKRIGLRFGISKQRVHQIIDPSPRLRQDRQYADQQAGRDRLEQLIREFLDDQVVRWPRPPLGQWKPVDIPEFGVDIRDARDT